MIHVYCKLESPYLITTNQFGFRVCNLQPEIQYIDAKRTSFHQTGNHISKVPGTQGMTKRAGQELRHDLAEWVEMQDVEWLNWRYLLTHYSFAIVASVKLLWNIDKKSITKIQNTWSIIEELFNTGMHYIYWRYRM